LAIVPNLGDLRVVEAGQGADFVGEPEPGVIVVMVSVEDFESDLAANVTEVQGTPNDAGTAAAKLVEKLIMPDDRGVLFRLISGFIVEKQVFLDVALFIQLSRIGHGRDTARLCGILVSEEHNATVGL
jgi:hypothetical protein